MSKVCVVTPYKHNYGAFLQAYASQRFLESLGYEAEVLNYDYYRDRTILGVYIGKISSPVFFFKNVVYRMTRYSVAKVRDELMEKCAEEAIKQTPYCKSYKKLKKNPPDADIFITGSDQVWNPTISEQGFLSRLLEFVPDGKKVLCSYAASVGVKSFSEKAKAQFRENLKRFDRISLREASSIPILQEVTDKEMVLHKDPTLLLNVEQWDRFAKKINTDKPYVFLYLAQRSPELVEYAEKLAKEKGWGIVDCHANVNYEISESVNGKGILSPMEFVGGIRNAAYVVTNSFHCLVFTTHYQKKAYVKLPPMGSSRLSELIERMKLDRLTDPEEIADGETDEIYRYAPAYLDEERDRAREYMLSLGEILEAK